MKLNIVFINFCFVVLLAGCTKIVDVEVSDSDPKFLIEAHLFNENGNNLVYVRKTQNVFSETLEPALPNAIVTIEVEDSIFNLLYDANGYYNNSTLIGVPGKTYNLKVEIEGNIFTSSSKMPNEVELFEVRADLPFRSNIDTSQFNNISTEQIFSLIYGETKIDDLQELSQEQKTELYDIIQTDSVESIRLCAQPEGYTNDELMALSITEKNELFNFYFVFNVFLDEPDVKNYYWFDYDRKGNEDDQIYIGDDLALDGIVSQVPYFNNCFYAGEEINSLIYSITEPVFNYLTVVDNVSNNGSPFGDVTPQNPEGNIMGENVLGYFNVACIKRDSIIVGE